MEILGHSAVPGVIPSPALCGGMARALARGGPAALKSIGAGAISAGKLFSPILGYKWILFNTSITTRQSKARETAGFSPGRLPRPGEKRLFAAGALFGVIHQGLKAHAGHYALIRAVRESPCGRKGLEDYTGVGLRGLFGGRAAAVRRAGKRKNPSQSRGCAQVFAVPGFRSPRPLYKPGSRL